jgi:hypothetical protein
VVFVLKGGKYSLRYLYQKQLSEKYEIYRRTIKSIKQREKRVLKVVTVNLLLYK